MLGLVITEVRESIVETEDKQTRWGFRGKTFWNWLELLVIPLTLAAIGFMFDLRQQQIEEERAERAQQLEERRAQDTALQAYLDQMGDLLLVRKLRESPEGSEERTLARARTLTVLARLDPRRKADVMGFLIEANLVQGVEGPPIISLAGANLSGADLSDVGPSDAGPIEFGPEQVSPPSAFFPTGADLRGAVLREADLREVDLSSADLTGADLSSANLRGATGITNEELAQQASSLEGTTMPNGQKYEDWLKSEGSREDGGNTGPS
jgi:uncharacterized protein YjbI with pentapeptide repeats